MKIEPTRAEHGTENRALVVIETPSMRNRTPIHRQGAFLAHLIATKDRHPQTRERRRADPHEALKAYRAAAALARA